MSLFVEFRLSGDPIVVTSAAAAVPDVTFEIERWRTGEDLMYWYLWTEGENLDRATAAFEELPTARSVTVISDAPDVRLTCVSVELQIDPPSDDLLQEGTLASGYVEPTCLHLAANLSGRDALTAGLRYLRDNGMDVTVERLRHEPPDVGDDRLSEKQSEALVTAHELGYFDDAASVTQDEVAEELGISRSAVSERLRRAQRELVERHLALPR